MRKITVGIIILFSTGCQLNQTPVDSLIDRDISETEGIIEENVNINSDNVDVEKETVLVPDGFPAIKTVNSSELNSVDSAFQFSAEIPDEWQVEYVPGSQAINFYLPGSGDSGDESDTLNQSQIFVKYFTASQFLTLSTVTIHSQEEFEINGRPTVQYDIEKMPGVAAFASQPDWRNERHFVTDIRSTDDSPAVFYVFGQRPDLDDEVFEKILESIEFGN